MPAAQRSVFSCTAFYALADVTVGGAFKSYRRIAESGRFNEANFCPECGCAVFTRIEAWPDIIGVTVGCFADPAFDRPGTLFWSSRRHSWLGTLPAVARVDRQ